MREPIINNAWNPTTLQALQTKHCADHQSDIQAWQKEELRNFVDSGFPNRKNENWKYTNVAAIAKKAFVISPQPPSHIGSHSLEMAHSHSLVFVNGHYHAALSKVDKLPKGVILSDLKTMLCQHNLSQELRIPAVYKTPFSTLNSALLMNGLFLSIPAGVCIDSPIHVININTSVDEVAMNHPRHMIMLGDNSRAILYEEYYASSDGCYLNNIVTQIYAGCDSQLHHYKLQNEGRNAFHIANTIVRQNKNSQVTTCHVALGGRLSRDDLNYSLGAEGAHCKLKGLYCATGQSHIDNHSRIDHLVSHCKSQQQYKGIMNGESKGVFNGKIVVHANSQQTVAQQSNQNLLLSPNAEINTKPELEIYADDVQCVHGATVGQLAEDALFYLQSRGIARDVANHLLTCAFADEILNQISHNNIAVKLKQSVVKQLVTKECNGDCQYE